MDHSPSLMPPWAGAIVLVLAAVVLGLWWRRMSLARTARAWARFADGLNEWRWESETPPLRGRGRLRGFALFLQEAVSHDEEAAYAHTRGALNVRNPANLVLGMRHKSLLEQAATRREAPQVSTGDAEFDRAFFVVLTVPEQAVELLEASIRRRLLRYPDIEIYLRSGQLEWRVAGRVASASQLGALFGLLADMADRLESLPPRPITLTRKLEDEALIERGV